jgi:hypothetical protein
VAGSALDGGIATWAATTVAIVTAASTGQHAHDFVAPGTASADVESERG